MGQEFLEGGRWSDGVALDWAKADRFSGILSLYRDLIRLRRNWFDTTRGLQGQNVHVHHVNDHDKVVGFHRWKEGGPRDDVVVLANFGGSAFDAYRIGLPRGGVWQVRFNSDWSGYSSLFENKQAFSLVAIPWGEGANMPFAGCVGLGRYTAILLSQDG